MLLVIWKAEDGDDVVTLELAFPALLKSPRRLASQLSRLPLVLLTLPLARTAGLAQGAQSTWLQRLIELLPLSKPAHPPLTHRSALHTHSLQTVGSLSLSQCGLSVLPRS